MSDEQTTPNAELDTCGLLCPLPVLKARKRLQSMTTGEILRMVADDPAARVDVPHSAPSKATHCSKKPTVQTAH